MVFPFPLLKQGKEEEEFSTGPLSVLMMSVKNNTQVGGFPLETTIPSLLSVCIDFSCPSMKSMFVLEYMLCNLLP